MKGNKRIKNREKQINKKPPKKKQKQNKTKFKEQHENSR